MKAEDVTRLIVEAARALEPAAKLSPDDVLSVLDQRELALLTLFARACEQNGIERAKAKLIWETRHSESFGIPYAAPDWSALDAEIEKENEGG